MILHVYRVNLKAWGMWSCDFLFGGGLCFKCPEITFWRWRRRQKTHKTTFTEVITDKMHHNEPTCLDSCTWRSQRYFSCCASFPLSSPCCFGCSPVKAWTFFAKDVVANNVSFSLSSEISMVKRLGFCFFFLLVLWSSRNVMKHTFLLPSTSVPRQHVYICTRFCLWYIKFEHVSFSWCSAIWYVCSLLSYVLIANLWGCVVKMPKPLNHAVPNRS